MLLIEDNPADVHLTRMALENGAIPKVVHVATDGEQALRFLLRRAPHQKAPRPDLVILDLNLPKVDGRQVLEFIKGDPNLMRIPVVVFSTSVCAEDIRGAYENHANCYLPKPSDLTDYLNLVSSIDEYWLRYVELPF